MLCTDADKKELLGFLMRRPTANCFFIGDIENFSLDESFMDVWKFGRDGKITSVLLRYYRYYQISCENHEDLAEMVAIIREDIACLGVSGMEEDIDALSSYIDFPKMKRTYLAELTKNTFRGVSSVFSPKKATVDDIDELFEFQKSIEEFAIDERSRESFGTEIRTGTGRTYFIAEDGRIVSSATITAENSINGTIIGVATDAAYRRKGYAKACTGQICKEMVEQDKNVILFYHNLDAGRLYKEIGFQDVGRWSMGSF